MRQPVPGAACSRPVPPMVQFTQFDPFQKHILDLDPLKGARPVAALIELRGDNDIGAFSSMLEQTQIDGRQSYWCPT
jgi:hypothetical protein